MSLRIYQMNLRKISHKPTRIFLTKIWKRVHLRNRDCIIAICGGTGSGKSMIALTLANWLDIDHNGKSRFRMDRIVFGYDQWVNVLKKDYPAGSVIIMEEPEVYFNANNYMSIYNKSGANKFNTGRVFRYIYLLTYPSFEDIDLKMRKRIHYRIDVKDYDPTLRVNYWQPKKLYRNPMSRYPPVLPKYIPVKEFGERWKIGECKTYAMSNTYYDAYSALADPWKKMVQTDELGKGGNPLALSDNPITVKVDPWQRQQDRRKAATRLRDVQTIEDRGLKDISSVGEIVKKGISYVQAYRIWRILEEWRVGENIDAINDGERQQVLGRS